jgi:hypothetical protein
MLSCTKRIHHTIACQLLRKQSKCQTGARRPSQQLIPSKLLKRPALLTRLQAHEQRGDDGDDETGRSPALELTTRTVAVDTEDLRLP